MGIFRWFACLALAATSSPLALAHAVLVHSTPQRDEVVRARSLHVQLKFNSRIDGPRCTLALVEGGGPAQTLQLAKQVAPDELDADTTNLKPGSYSLRWQALASDGHITRGEVPFSIK